MKKIILIIVIIAVILLYVIFLLPKLVGWFVLTEDNLCDVTILKELCYPNKEYKVVLYLLDCGATASTSINVRILEYNKAVTKEAGNVFSGRYSGIEDSDIIWKDQKVLQIVHFCRESDIFKSENEYLGIRIEYQNK